MVILEEHMKGCIAGAIRKNESDEKLIHEAMELKLF